MCNDRNPDAWVTCGDVLGPLERPNWDNPCFSEDIAKHWCEIGLRVRPIYLGEELPIIYDPKKAD